MTLRNIKYRGYGVGFDSKGTFSHSGCKFGQNVTIFGADMSQSVHTNNKTKNFLIIGEGITQILDDTTLTPAKMYSFNFTVSKKNSV